MNPECHKIKDIKIVNSQEVIIDGDNFVKRKSFVTELEHIVNHIHFSINGTIISIEGNICFLCGKIFKGNEKLHKGKTQHHSIPDCLNPKYNVLVPICKECHIKINKKIK